MRTCRVRLGEEEFDVGIDDTGGTLAVTLSGRTHRVDLIEIVPACYTLIVDGASHRLALRDRAGPWVFELDGRTEVAEVTRTGVGAAAARGAAERTCGPRPACGCSRCSPRWMPPERSPSATVDSRPSTRSRAVALPPCVGAGGGRWASSGDAGEPRGPTAGNGTSWSRGRP